MARIISIVNQKGGTGKSACTANLAVGLAQKNMKVLIVDADPQSDVSGLVVCGDCGAMMIKRDVPAGGKVYAYYICSRHAATKACAAHRIPMGKLEETVLEDKMCYGESDSKFECCYYSNHFSRCL